MDFSQAQDTQNTSSAEDQAIYVEELAGAGDYWLSITDASRVCRVQDVSIRRAITRKVLPVRRQRAGQNKRTRFVRASDLAQAGFPIIDESATITTEIGKVDVLSIPRQQQQIVREHQALTLRLSEIQETLTTHQEQISADLHLQQERFQTSLQTTREEQIRQLAVIEMRNMQEQQNLQKELEESTRQLFDEQQTLRQDLVQEQVDALARNEHLQTVVDALHQDLTRELAATCARDERFELTINTLRADLAQERSATLSRAGHLQTAVDALQSALVEHQQVVQRQLTDLALTQEKLLQDYVNKIFQRAEQETQARLLDIEQRLSARSQQLTHTFDARLTELAKTLAQVQQTAESAATRDQEFDRTLQHQQAQIEQHEQLLPLLAYVQQHLVTERDMATWSQALADLETRLLANQQREFERFQPLLGLLAPERVETLKSRLAKDV